MLRQNAHVQKRRRWLLVGSSVITFGLLAGCLEVPEQSLSDDLDDRPRSNARDAGKDAKKSNEPAEPGDPDMGDPGKDDDDPDPVVSNDSGTSKDAAPVSDASPPPRDAAPPDAGTTGPSLDGNGVGYIAFNGFRYVTTRGDFQASSAGGSMRQIFLNTPQPNQCVYGYFLATGGPNTEEFSVALGGGPHTSANPDWADTYNIGVASLDGTRARLRFVPTFPNYTNGPVANVTLGDLRNKWVGAMGCKLSVDSNADGQVDRIRVFGFVDASGLDANGKPKNRWVKTLDVSLAVADVPLKSPAVPYVTTIGHPEAAQVVARVDNQDPNTFQYRFVTYRVLQQL